MNINFLDYYHPKTKNRKLLKAVNIVIMATFILNMSAVQTLLLAQPAQAVSKISLADNVQYRLEGQRKDGSFTTGNICSGSGECYAEGENVPFKLTIDGLTSGDSYSVKIQHDYQDNVGIPGYVNFNSAGTWDGSASNVVLSNPVTTPGLPNTITYDLSFDADSAIVQLKWLALLSQSAGEWSGAQLHARLVEGVNQEPIGNKEVPIQVNEIVIRNLTVSKTDDPDPINIGEATTYTITITNEGEQDETVIVTDELPTELVYVSGSGSPSPTSVSPDGRTITWQNILVPEDGQTQITFDAEGVAAGTGTNNVTVNAVGLDPVCADEDTTVIGQASLSLNKTDNPDPVLAGNNITYTLSGSVEGNLTAQNVVLEDPIPADTTYVSLTGPGTYNSGTNTVTWNFGNQQPGPIDPVQLTVQTDPYLQNGDMIYNTATIDADNTDPAEAEEDTTVITDCVLTFTKQVSATQANPGDILTYTLSYENIGNSVCSGSGALVYDDLDDNLAYVNGSFTANEYNGNGDGITYLGGFNGVDPLANAWTVIPGESGVITFAAQINEELSCGITNVPNQARIWSYQAGDVLSNQVNTEINIPCSLTVIKHVNGGSAQASDWTMNVTGPENHSFPGAEVPGTTINLSNTGNYNVAESGGPGGYMLTYSGDCNENGNVTISAGDEKTCTLINTRNAGTLIVIKHVDGGSAQASDWTMEVNGPEYFSFPGQEAPGTSNTVTTGNYVVTETGGPAGYSLSYSGDCDQNGNVRVGPNQKKICTLTNTRDTGTLTVIKHVINDDGGNAVASDWTMNVTGPENHSFLGSETGVSGAVMTGNYQITESGGQTGYALTYSGDCDANGNITINQGDDKTCTLTNNDASPSITLTKNVINNDGGTAGVNEFGLTIGGVPVNSGQTLEVNANTPIALDEAGLFGYSFVSITGDPECPQVLGGTVILDEDEHIACTITNDDIAPTLTLIKNVVNDNGGTLQVPDFPLFIDATQVTSGIAET
ncbi:MAG: hypothetical protein COY66_03995, partial [Candidatus Kerfeldbacteria bacterium CG_4_10_14_0_8_um_filter_42_10]